MTPAQVAAQKAVEAANNQKSRCELPVGSVGFCEQFMLSLAFILYVCILYVWLCLCILQEN